MEPVRQNINFNSHIDKLSDDHKKEAGELARETGGVFCL